MGLFLGTEKGCELLLAGSAEHIAIWIDLGTKKPPFASLRKHGQTIKHILYNYAFVYMIILLNILITYIYICI